MVCAFSLELVVGSRCILNPWVTGRHFVVCANERFFICQVSFYCIYPSAKKFDVIVFQIVKIKVAVLFLINLVSDANCESNCNKIK
jgi:hypothetical protein